MSKRVRYDIETDAPPALSATHIAELKAIANLPDNIIDYSDTPPLDAQFWQRAVHNHLYKPTKTSTTIRVDTDILAWLKSQGKGYQTRLNAILREAMLADLQHKS